MLTIGALPIIVTKCIGAFIARVMVTAFAASRTSD
jgi:hypothetical protein